MKILKKILFALLIIFVAIQFIRPHKNKSSEITASHIYNMYPASPEVKSILNKACNDCHSNNTNYPWYAQIQPAAWWLNDHIKDGKRKLNFSEFGTYRIAKQYKKLDECNEEVKEGEMPIEPYTYIHRNAKLTQDEKIKLAEWTIAIRDSIEAKYPADSLVLPKRKVESK